MKKVKIYLIVFVITLLVSSTIFVGFPYHRKFLVMENSVVENISAFSYFVCFILALIFSIILKKNRKWFCLLSIIGLLGFLDEISFGNDVFDMSFPVIDGFSLNAVHDLVYLAYSYIFTLIAESTIFNYAVLGISIVFILILYRYRSIFVNFLKYALGNSSLILFFIFGILIVFAMIIDLGMVQNEFLFVLEELFEMNSGIALVFCCLSLKDTSSIRKSVVVNS